MIDQKGHIYKNRPEALMPFDEMSNIQIELCEIFIKLFFKKSKSGIMHKRGSYGYKHDVEKWCGRYISSGAFSQAAINLGYEAMFRHEHGYFNMVYLETPRVHEKYCRDSSSLGYSYPYCCHRGKGVPEKYQMLTSKYWDDEEWVPKYPEYYPAAG